MKPLSLFFLLGMSLYCQSNFILPQEHNRFVDTMQKELRKTSRSLIIITDHLHSSWLKNEIKTRAKKNVHIIVVTQGDDDTESLALYQNITIRRIQAINSPYYHGILSFSLLYFDDQTGCWGSTSLDDTTLQHDVSFFTCKSNTEFASLAQMLLLQSVPYLK
jgi:hypothetical protein